MIKNVTLFQPLWDTVVQFRLNGRVRIGSVGQDEYLDIIRRHYSNYKGGFSVRTESGNKIEDSVALIPSKVPVLSLKQYLMHI